MGEYMYVGECRAGLDWFERPGLGGEDWDERRVKTGRGELRLGEAS
jgi:hypothetical protein